MQKTSFIFVTNFISNTKITIKKQNEWFLPLGEKKKIVTVLCIFLNIAFLINVTIKYHIFQFCVLYFAPHGFFPVILQTGTLCSLLLDLQYHANMVLVCISFSLFLFLELWYVFKGWHRWLVGLLLRGKKVPSFKPGWSVSVWRLHVLPLCVWILSRYSDFLPQSKTCNCNGLQQPQVQHWVLFY